MANLRLAPGRRALSGFCGIGFLMRDGLHVLPRTLEHGFGGVAGPGSGISKGDGERSLFPPPFHAIAGQHSAHAVTHRAK